MRCGVSGGIPVAIVEEPMKNLHRRRGLSTLRRCLDLLEAQRTSCGAPRLSACMPSGNGLKSPGFVVAACEGGIVGPTEASIQD